MQMAPVFDIFFPVHTKDMDVFIDALPVNIAHILGARTIFIATNDEDKMSSEIARRGIAQDIVRRIVYVPEAAYPFSFEDVRPYIDDRWPKGWYYQQLLKLYIFDVLPGCADRVLVVDGDIVFLRPLNFVDTQGRAYLAYDEAVHQPYRAWMRRLLPGITSDDKVSGVTDHMLFEREILMRMRADIEAAHNGAPFWRLFLSLVDRNVQNAASEFDLYYFYALQFFSDRIVRRTVAKSHSHTWADDWQDWRSAVVLPFEAHRRHDGLLMMAFHGWKR